VRKRSDSNNLYCAKAKRQQQSLLCESEATATTFTVRKRSDSNNLYCAKAKRQQQSLLCESEATATTVFVPKVKRQVQNTSIHIGGKMNAVFSYTAGVDKAPFG